MKLMSGVISDYLRRRKLLITLGYSLLMLSRPLMAVSSTFATVFASRMMDRLGNGLQATPREALIADVAPTHIRGACYGVRQALATAGSFFGGVCGFLAMWWTAKNYQQVFWIATIPAIISVVLLIFALKDPLAQKDVDPETHSPRKHPLHWADIPRLGRSYWKLIGVATVFMMARVSEAFLILLATGRFGLDPTYAPMILMTYNLTYSLTSYPIGAISDRYGRYPVMVLGFFTLILADIVLALAVDLTMVFLGIAIWGIQLGITQNAFTAKIADLVPEDLKGTGFGFFYLITAIASVVSGSIAGYVCHFYNESIMFGVSAVIALFALGLLSLIKTKKKA